MKDLPYWIALNKVPGIGAKRFAKLIEHFGDAEAVWKAPDRELEAANIGAKALASLVQARREIVPAVEMERVDREGVQVLTLGSPGYPRLLARIDDPPPVLFVRGGFKSQDELAVAVIGTRTASPSGLIAAEELAADLAHQGITVISGMARGIDTAGHQGALKAGGRTIAVLGSGLDVIYPPENAGLYYEICDNGAVVSEFALGSGPIPANFPARNRIISGLSLGVAVVEAADDSGSLITAGHAAEQGRDVFAVPGPVGLEGSRGPHRLIKQGAKLIEGAQDILAELALPFLSPVEISAARDLTDLSPEERMILDSLDHNPRHTDIILRDLGLPSGVVGAALIMLEMKGLVKQWSGGFFTRMR